MPTLIEVRVVEGIKGKGSPWELKMIYSDGSWSFFSRGFSTKAQAYKYAKKGFPKLVKELAHA